LALHEPMPRSRSVAGISTLVSVAGVAEHQPLVAGALVEVVVLRGIHALRDNPGSAWS